MHRNRGSSPRIEICFLVHATEDLDKVLQAVTNIFPEDHSKDIDYEKSFLLGYHKNPIIMVKTSIEDKLSASSFLRRVLTELEPDDKILLSAGIRSQIDSRQNFYLRLDKQEAFLGRLKLCTIDPIHIKARLKALQIPLEELESLVKS
ncbi:MAG: RNA-binding domain-containing protein [Candidatus Bathyarchaeota archaeon]